MNARPLLLGLAALSPAYGLDYFWNLGTSGNWSDPSRWGPLNQVPDGAGNTVELFVDTAGGHVGGPIHTITMDGSYSLDGFTHISDTCQLYASGRTFTINGPSVLDGYQLTFTGGSNYVTNGAFTHSSGHFDLLSSSLSGSGSYTLSGGTATFSAATLSVPVSQSTGGLALQGATVFSSGFSSTGGSVSFDALGNLTLNNTGWSNGGAFTVSASDTTVNFNSNTTPTFTNLPAGTVTFEGGGTGQRRFYHHLDNQGAFNVNTPVQLLTSNGTHTNSGTLTAPADFSTNTIESFDNSGNLTSTGGALSIIGNLSGTSSFDNSGTVTVANGLDLRFFVDYENSGTIDVDGGHAGILTAYYGTSHTFTNAGDIDAAPGTTVSFSPFSWGTGQIVLAPGSTLGGGGTISFNSQAVDLQGPWSPGTSPLIASSSSLNGTGPLTIANGSSLTSTDSNFGTTTSNHGDASFSGSNNTTNGAFTNEADGSLTLENGARLRIHDNDLTNHGQIDFASGTGQSYFYENNASSLGSFINAPTGSVIIEGTGTRRLRCNTDNQGQITLNTRTDYDSSGGVHSNSGTITAAGQFYLTSAESFDNSGDLTSTGGYLNIVGNLSPTSAFSNSGTVTAANGLLLRNFHSYDNSGTLDIDGGSAVVSTTYYGTPLPFTNTGDIDVAPGASISFSPVSSGTGPITLAPGSTLGGGGTISFNSQAVDLQGPWSPGASQLVTSSSSLNGTGPLTIANGSSLTSTDSNFGTTTSNHGDASFSGSNNTTNGAFTNEADGSLTLENGARLRIHDNDLTNHGQIDFASGTGQSYFYENNTSSLGSFVNAPTGSVIIEGTGTRRLRCNTDNQGQITLNTRTDFDSSGGVHSNSGTITAAGQFYLASAESFDNSGDLTSTGGYLNIVGNLSPTSAFSNSGTVTAANGLLLRNFQSYDNSGTLDIDGGSAVVSTAYYGTPLPFTNTGDIDVAPGASISFSPVSSGTGPITLAPGSTLGGGGTISFSGQSLDLQGPWSPGASPLVASSSSLNGTGPLITDDGVALTSTASNFNTTTSNHGDASFSGSNTAYGAFTNEADGSLTLANSSNIRIDDNDFTNHGQLTFDTGTSLIRIYDFDAASLGTFVNSPTGTFTAEGTGQRRLTCNVDNQGLFVLNTKTDLNDQNASHSNSGTIHAGGQLYVYYPESFDNSGTITSTGGNLYFHGNFTPTSSFSNSGTMTVEDGSTVQYFQTVENSGTVHVNNGTANFVTAYLGTPYSVTNSGDIVVAPGATASFYRSGASGTTGNLALAPGSTLAGGGQINFSNTAVDLQETWSPGASPVSLSSSSLNGTGPFITDDGVALTSTASNFNTTTSNHGDASFSGSNTAYGAFTNEADGSLTVANSSSIRIDDNDFTNHGQLTFDTGTSLIRIYDFDAASLGTFVNSPTGTFTAEGTGQRRLTCNVDNQGLFVLNTKTDLNDQNASHSNSGTIHAGGQLYVYYPESFDNSGTITSTGGNLYFYGNFTPTSSFSNSGTMTVENGSTVQYFQTVENSGTVHVNNGTANFVTAYLGTSYSVTNSGTIDVAPGATASFYRSGASGIGTATNETTGRLTGSGTVAVSNTTFTNHGTIAPGNSTGVLTLGAMNHSASSVFEIEIADASGPGSGHDQVVVNGNLALNGTLEITRIGAYVPSPSDSFVIMTCTGELTGNFASVVQSDPAGTWEVEVDEDNDQVVLTFVGDGTIDYAAFQQAHFTPTEIANGDADPEVDFDGDGLANLLEWIHGFDPTSGVHPVAPLVVERTPGTLDLIYPESALLPENAYSVTVLTDTDLAGGFATIPALDVTRLADTPVPGLPDVHRVTLRLENANWNTDDARYFQLEFAATP